MFESFETGRKIAKKDFEALEPEMRLKLLNAQFDSRSAEFPTVILLAGNDRVGANEVIDLLHAWMDARGLDTSVFSDPTDVERERPLFWRYWQALPAAGRIGILLGAWCSGSVRERARGNVDDLEWERHLSHVRRLEQQLVADGTLLLKFWLHVPRKEFSRRLGRAEKNPDSEPYVEKRDREVLDRWEKLQDAGEEFVRRTDTEWAPWRIVESSDKRHRGLEITQTLVSGLHWALGHESASAASSPPPPADLAPLGSGLLDAVDLTASVPIDEYRDRRKKLQGRVARLTRKARRKDVATVLAFEGWDAAGKGGAIRRLTQAIAARDFAVSAIQAPSEDEKRHHYLWRFWRALPRAGRVRVFDRTWYGRVLVERVEGFATEAEWTRAYAEINDFEEHLVERGFVLRKFWLHISPGEQLRRFQAREKTTYKHYKITGEDWRNRDKWEQYERAVVEMIARTSTKAAPWKIIAANDKRHARLDVLATVVEALERRLD
jgi:polyphosphate:AMP phosphotransferase